MKLNHRNLRQLAEVGTAGMSVTLGCAIAKDASAQYTFLPLPYDCNALKLDRDRATLRLHNDKHHPKDGKGLNSVLPKLPNALQLGDFSNVQHLERLVAFHGAGDLHHTLYWNNMRPKGGGE